MKDTILQLIEDKPKHYTKILSKNEDMLNWVDANTLVTTAHLPSRIYSAVYQVSDICNRGNVKRFDRFSSGFIGCGPANICPCTKENIATNVAKTKATVTVDENKEINNKRAATMIEMYGHAYNSQRADKKECWTKPKIPLIIHEKLTNFEWLNTEYNTNFRSLSDIAYELDVHFSTVGVYCSKFGFKIRPSAKRSVEEIQIFQYIESLGLVVEHSNREIISPKELDIVITGGRIAFEIDGLWSHSYNPSNGKKEDRMRHINKTIDAKVKDVTLFHITDYEWHHCRDIITAMIRSRLGFNSKIAARKCTISLVDKKIEKEFLTKYHIQGHRPSDTAIGLYQHDELVMVMSIGKPRFNTKYDYEILRMCTKADITVIGGVSKIVSYIKKHYPNNRFISYCDLSKGTGTGYAKAGFMYIATTKPGYFWTNGNIMISRYKCQKKNIEKWLTSYDPALSEAVNMFNAKYRRFSDCGNAIYELIT